MTLALMLMSQIQYYLEKSLVVFASKTIVIIGAFSILLITYARIFFGAEVTDEPYHIACAYLTALGSKFYANDSYYAQTASLIYEPIIFIYHHLVGNEGVVLFVRHLYFFLALGTATSFFLLLRRLIDPKSALLASLLPLVFIPYSIPILSYNTLAYHGFGIGCALTIQAVMTRRIHLYLWGAFCFALAAFAYPSFVLGVAGIYFGLAIRSWIRFRKIGLDLVTGAVASGALFLFFWAVTLLRFDLDLVLHSIKTTEAYGSLSRFSDKFDHFMSVVGILTPPIWTLGVVLPFLILFRCLKWSWLWNIPIVTAIYFFTVPTPTWSLISSPYITFIFCVGLLMLLTSSRPKQELDDFTWVVAGVTAVLGFAVGMTSSNHVLAMAFITQFGLVFLIAEASRKISGGLLHLLLLLMLGSVGYWNFTYVYRDEPMERLNTMIDSGPFRGIVTSSFKAELLNAIRTDIISSSHGAESILFYDNFPAGYLFTSLRPATRSLFIHPLPYGNWDRQLYTEYYKEAKNRPDVFVQFEAFPYSQELVVAYRNQWTVPPHDTFFDYLESTGEYRIVVARPFYKVWRKINLPN